MLFKKSVIPIKIDDISPKITREETSLVFIYIDPFEYKISDINNIKKLNILLPIIFPTVALKFPIFIKAIEEESSGKDVAMPKNNAPAKVDPILSFVAMISVVYVIKTLANIRLIAIIINLVIICFIVNLHVSSIIFSSSEEFISLLDKNFTDNI